MRATGGDIYRWNSVEGGAQNYEESKKAVKFGGCKAHQWPGGYQSKVGKGGGGGGEWRDEEEK